MNHQQARGKSHRNNMNGMPTRSSNQGFSTTFGAMIALSLVAMMSACTATQNMQQAHVVETADTSQHQQNSIIQQIQPMPDFHDHHDGHSHVIPKEVGTKADFEAWLSVRPYYMPQIASYERYLISQIGEGKVPPMHELLTTARSWQECGHEPYEVPPPMLWSAMIPTILLFNDLQEKGVLPADTKIRSVYRNPKLNRCAGGAVSSKHMTNGAMDIWVPSIDMGSHEMSELQNRLCEYWLHDGKAWNFGLGLYATGAIHLDTQGHRKWGAQFSQKDSICRITPPKTNG
ncbi:D-Ala-D-Ala carboxypeptidase family metallohydrolase [Moraxella sp. Tifton1]|uniref:D-Ala-D-Ala carboxypeptidase family metallohydrolase n=1 Tax=Moraxella oculi TaxID=2940516 RepID=UPI002012E081|nr:D-Ala-D-Ala carboxypeptidase family metallohydrolase [Moraxella sp. Tifton1]MCL1622686.1 D-Ala-D-Ala carboxypeptidase family metallohydrolase [Moraxella sp. Tifton1]